MVASCHVLFASILLFQLPIFSSFSIPGHSLARGSSLYVKNKNDLLVSPNGLFTAGFHQVGNNAFGFAVWFSVQVPSESRTVVWMANRDEPVNGKNSKLSLWENGNLVLEDAGQYVIWSTQTKSTSSLVQLWLDDNGNLVLLGGEQTIWQSFDHPTDTLLPNQPFTKSTQLVSSRSANNYSSGFYKLFFDNDSVLRLLYNGHERSTIFWPDPGLATWEADRFLYIDTRTAMLESNGQFNSSDGLSFTSADLGMGPQRILRIDIDGNVRVYSRQKTKWEVQWQAISDSCMIHGTCGPNSLCTYSRDLDRKCTCLHGHKMVNSKDWSYGCEPEFKLSTQDECDFIELRHTRFYGYDTQFFQNNPIDDCRKYCLQDNTCRGYEYGWSDEKKSFYCFTKSSLHNGYRLGYEALMYIKLPKRLVSSFNQKTTIQSNFSCPHNVLSLAPIIRTYDEKHDIKPFEMMLVFGCTIGFIEIICIVIFWYCSTKHSVPPKQSYLPASSGFRKFTYNELKRASRNFRDEIGRGGASIVYKGRLADDRIAAIKMLTNTNYDQGEAEFQAEISTIGRVNHMNLIEAWGYCAEGKHRLVVYEYMENGSLAEKLVHGKLDWATRLHIANGTAKGLAYLHEDCLEWVLHCDVKPHNILLDDHNNPKVADFGLSKLLDRGDIDQCHFSMVRGTLGYMAPEWVFNLPITSKVDVYSYGVVILEMITGRSPSSRHQTSNQSGKTDLALVDWVRYKIQEFDPTQTESWVNEIVDPSINGEYDQITVENLVRIALQCVEEDKDVRLSMSHVVDMLDILLCV